MKAKRAFRFKLLTFFLIAGFSPVPFTTEVASADSLNGLLDIGYARSDVKNKDSSGAATNTQSSGFFQQYRLGLNKSFYPNLNLIAGGVFEKLMTDTDSGGVQTTSTNTIIQPSFDLRLTTPLYKAGVGYNRRENELKTSGAPSSTNVNERQYATLGWMPEGFPDWNLRLEKSDTFDKERVRQDTSTEQAILAVHYAYKGLDLRYQPSYRDEVNRIDDLEQKNRTHNGRATYSGSFFQGRTTLSANYEVTRSETEIIASGAGEVSFPLIPLSGLSALDDSPAEGALDPNPALIDGNLTASAGLNLGLPPLGGDTRPRNMGVDFLIPPETNTLYVWVDRELPPEIANAFSWEVYTSPDNKVWNLATTVLPAPFGSFQNRFEIRLPKVTSRFVKVVTRPLTAIVPGAAEFPEIFVTEIQAFLTKPADEVKGKITRTTQTGSVDFRTMLLDRPSLYYDFSYNTVNVSPPSRSQSSMINGLSASHVFSRIFSANGRFSREDNRTVDGLKESAYVYTASLQAVPLKTLRHVLLFSGRNDQLVEESRDVYTLILQNSAQLYRGIDIFLNGGVTREKSDTGERLESENLLFGAAFVPNRTLTVTLNFNGTWTDRTGGDRPDETIVDRRGDASISYRPFDTLYLLAAFSRIERPGIIENTQNYSLNWSPFPSGALLFNFAFNQDLSTRDNAKVQTIRPSLRWNITNRISLDMSYQVVTAEASTGESDDKTFSTRMRVYF
jgi:opacity protein-like surface antigen